jgi:hypothetical protein
MSTCSNCKGRMSCGCQRRTASNGVQCCSSCVKGYEQSLKKDKQSTELLNTVSNTIWNKNRFTNK